MIATRTASEPVGKVQSIMHTDAAYDWTIAVLVREAVLSLAAQAKRFADVA